MWEFVRRWREEMRRRVLQHELAAFDDSNLGDEGTVEEEYRDPHTAAFVENPQRQETKAVESPLYWTSAMDSPSRFDASGMEWDEIDVVSEFLAKLALSVGQRGVLLDGHALMRLADDLNPEKAAAILTEPWMSPFKRNANEAIALGRVVTQAALSEIGFDALAAAGLPGAAGRSAAEIEQKAFLGDRNALGQLAEALRRISSPLGETMATSIDYVLACLGDRGAMARVADRLSELARIAADGRPFLENAGVEEAVISADTWRRLSVSSIKDRADGFDLLSREIASRRFDLVRPWHIEKAIPGLAMPPISAEAAKLAATSMSRGPSDRRRRRKAMNGGTASADDVTRALFPPPYISVPAIAEEAGPTASAAADADGAKATVFVQVLDRIVGGDHGSGAETTYGHLLEPVPVIRPPDPDFLYRRLKREFPWMEEANAKAALAAAASARTAEGGYRLPPLVLAGRSGVGKSRWARRLAELCQLPMHAASLAGSSSSKSIMGSERGWASARPSLPALAFSSARVANPVILVDEVDKSEHALNGDALAALLPMLERETAKRYPDVYLLGSLDVSRISFVFTANSISGLPQEFLDRVEVVNVPRPGIKEYPSIAASLVAEAMADFAIGGEGSDRIAEEARAEAVKKLEAGGSIRATDAEVRKRISRSVWSPAGELKLVR